MKISMEIEPTKNGTSTITEEQETLKELEFTIALEEGSKESKNTHQDEDNYTESSTVTEKQAYVLPVPEFATVIHGDEEEIFLNLRCRKGTLLKYLQTKIGINQDVDKLELASMSGGLVSLRGQEFNVQCTEFFPPGMHAYLPVLVYEDAPGLPSTVKWLVDDVTDMYPDACCGLERKIEELREAYSIQQEEMRLQELKEDMQLKEQDNLSKRTKSKAKEPKAPESQPEDPSKNSKSVANEDKKKKK